MGLSPHEQHPRVTPLWRRVDVNGANTHSQAARAATVAPNFRDIHFGRLRRFR